MKLCSAFHSFQMLRFFLFAVISTCVLKCAADTNEVIIQTRLGNIKGIRHTYMDKGNVYKFLDIPYGKAPVGHYRFQKPRPYGAWSSTLNATQLGPVCRQPTNQDVKYPGFTEDCLKLNIYIPNNLRSRNKKSVMVWVHGGAFAFGSGGMYDGSMLSLVGDVIVVTINYRLGIFGFLSSRNAQAKGNAGLWDQILAFNWVRYNIGDYGGNPNDITIFGESAGGFSVSIQSLIPSNRGLFHRVISQSGIANSFLTISNASSSTVEVGTKVGCAYSYHSVNDYSFIECMKRVDADVLLQAVDEVNSRLGMNAIIQIPFGPIVDGELIHRDPALLLHDKTSTEYNFYQSLDMMTGTCTGEGSLVVGLAAAFQNSLNFNFSQGVPTREMSQTLIPYFTKTVFNNSAGVSDMICNKYCVRGNNEEQGRQFLNMWSDAAFVAPATLALNSHSHNMQGSATYQYVFYDEFSASTPAGAPWYKGSAHATDVYYMFFYEQMKSTANFTQGASVLVNQMRSYWTNFAKTG
jgi:carboxylesterase type B